MTTDTLLIVPIEPPVAHIADPKVRRTHAAELHGPLGQALYELVVQLGRNITLDDARNRPRIGGELWPPSLEQR